jgi:hypothetical protein
VTGLKPETQALLELGRAGDDPSDAVIAHNRRQLAMKMGGAALGAAAVTGSATKVLAASSTLKVLALCGGVVAAGAALHGYAFQGPPPPQAPAVAPPARTAESVVERDPLASPAASEATRLAPPVEPAPRNATAAKSATPPSIQSELELIRGAQKHLHRGEASGALALLAEHARRFPTGVLAQERDASRVLALCLAGDVTSARSQAERFLQRSPQSPFAERVRASCAKVSR